MIFTPPMIRPGILRCGVIPSRLSVPSAWYPPVTTIAVMGDSIAGQTSADLYTFQDIGFFPWARAFNGSRWNHKASSTNIAFATAGANTLAIQSTHLSQVIAAAPSACVVQGGVNDYASGRTSAQTTATLREMWASLKAAKIRPIATTILPDAANTGRQAWIAATNILIRAAASSDGVTLCDWASAIETSPGVGSTTYTPDNLHPNNLGASKIGRVLAATIAGLPYTPADLWSNTNWLTAGNQMPGSLGQPTDWNLPTIASGATLNSKSLVSSDVGNWWQLDFSQGSATAASTLYSLAANISTIAGKTVEGIMEVQVISGGLRSIRLRCVTSGGTQESYDLKNSAVASADLVTASDGIIVLRTPRSVISAGVSQLWPQIQFAGTAVFQIRRTGIRKV